MMPPRTCAKLRLGENLLQLQDWKCHTFVMNVWHRYMARELLGFTGCSREFVKHAPYRECVEACRPEQVFRQLNAEKVLHHDFKAALRGPAKKRSVAVRLFLEFCRDRFRAGVVVSWPSSMLQVERAPHVPGQLMLAPEAAAGAAGLPQAPQGFVEESLVEDALAVVAAEVASPTRREMGVGCGHLRFREREALRATRRRAAGVQTCAGGDGGRCA